jgi:hypothetical protein
MSSVKTLRESRGKAQAVFMEFITSYKQNPSALYCFFEGEDSKYYGVRIKNIIRPEKDFYFSCSGKDGVLGIHKMLSARKSYAKVKAAYFIDRDFDESIRERGLNEIYETPCYSIENFYTSVQCFSEVLRSEFNLRESDENFERCVALYIKLQEEFHNAVELLNTWIACQRAKSSQLNISDISVSRFVTIDLNQITKKYVIDDLYRMFPGAIVITQEELDARLTELRSSTRQKSFRGKFEIEFLRKFLEKLIHEANKDNSHYFTRKVKVVLSLSKSNIISELSQYADTPDCLYSYLKSFISPS